MKWLFIIGCCNSGTTLLENILHQHPDIAGLSTEGQYLTEAFVRPRDIGLPRLWAQKETLFRFALNEEIQAAQQAKQDWLRQLDKPNFLYALERSPVDAARTLWLQHHFAPAYFVHIVRNGYVVSLGIEEKVRKVHGEIMPDLLSKAAYQWSRGLEIIIEDAPKLDHFLEISYEDLTENPSKVTTHILKFLQLHPLPQQILNQKYQVHQLHSEIKNQNKQRLSKMTSVQKRIIDQQAGKFLRQYGYKKRFIWF